MTLVLRSRNFRLVFAATVFLLIPSFTPTRADVFGSGTDSFDIDFVIIGNAGNGDDLGAGGGNYSSPYGGVDYVYRMGVYEISEEQILKATNGALQHVIGGAWSGHQPAANMTWLEAAAFVNWLNTSTEHQAAYDLAWTGFSWAMNLWDSDVAWDNDPGIGEDLNRYRHKDAYYFLPSEDEWYKAAFHKNDGVTADYWDFATGSNVIPTAVSNGTGAGTAVHGNFGPARVYEAGGLSPYGTCGQDGNVWEWQESAYDGINDAASELRVIRGGAYPNPDFVLRSSFRNPGATAPGDSGVGFRVASIPEPSTTFLAGLGWALFPFRRLRGCSARDARLLDRLPLSAI